MKHVKTEKWYAIYPVKTDDRGWVWLKEVWRTIDSRAEHYQGLLPTVTYRVQRRREEITNDIFVQMTEEERMELMCRQMVGFQGYENGEMVVLMGMKAFERVMEYEWYLIDKYSI